MKLALKASFVLFAAVAAMQTSFAMEIPQSCGADQHIQCARFNENQVYSVATKPGIESVLVLEDGEQVIMKGAGMGDVAGWHLTVNAKAIMFKPAALHPGTNLVILTNRRRYTLALHETSKDQPVTWVLEFSYPDTEARELAAKQKREADRAAAIAMALHPDGDALPSANLSYSMRGDIQLAPTKLWDNGRFTYFRYKTSRDLPKIFRILEDGQEATVNFHMEDGTIVAHETAKEFIIRQGDAVLGIRNDAYEPDGRYNASGSSEEGTVRVRRTDLNQPIANNNNQEAAHVSQ